MSNADVHSLFLAATLILSATESALACDEFASRLLTNAVRPAIEAMGCGDLARTGLDEAEHRLESLCYVSSGPQSEVTIVARLKCKAGGGAFLKAEISERVTARAAVRGSDCAILDLNVDAAGGIGKVLIDAFNVDGRVRGELKKALDKLCQ